MSKIFSIIFFLFNLIVISQTKVDYSNKEIYIDTTQSIDLSKKDIKDKTLSWVLNKYKNPKRVIRFNSEDSISIKAMFRVGDEFRRDNPIRKVYFFIGFKFMDGKYYIKTSDIRLSKNSQFMNIPYHLMDRSEYKEFLVKHCNKYNGNDFDNKFNTKEVYSNKLVNSIINNLNRLNSDIFMYIKKLEI